MSGQNRNRDPLEENEDKAERAGTSRNREESMRESGEDAFGDKSAVRKANTASSGTTGLGSESRNSDRVEGAGGVEGEKGTR
jgi:hypothetical protein